MEFIVLLLGISALIYASIKLSQPAKEKETYTIVKFELDSEGDLLKPIEKHTFNNEEEAYEKMEWLIDSAYLGKENLDINIFRRPSGAVITSEGKIIIVQIF
jgi:hypothetical protein